MSLAERWPQEQRLGTKRKRRTPPAERPLAERPPGIEWLKCFGCGQVLSTPAQYCNEGHTLHSYCLEKLGCKKCNGEPKWYWNIPWITGYPSYKRGQYKDSIYISTSPFLFSIYVVLKNLSWGERFRTLNLPPIPDLEDNVYLICSVFMYQKIVLPLVALPLIFTVTGHLRSWETRALAVILNVVTLHFLWELKYFWIFLWGRQFYLQFPRPSELTFWSVCLMVAVSTFLTTFLTLLSIYLNSLGYFVCVCAMKVVFKKDPAEASNAEYTKDWAEIAIVCSLLLYPLFFRSLLQPATEG